MGSVQRYLSQRRRIELYEEQMAKYEEFARDASKLIAKNAAEIERLKEELRQTRALTVEDFSKVDESTRRIASIVSLIIQAHHAPKWRDRREARRKCRELAK